MGQLARFNFFLEKNLSITIFIIFLLELVLNYVCEVELGITRLHDELDGLIRLTVSLP